MKEVFSLSPKIIPESFFEYSRELIISGSKFCGIRSIKSDNLFKILKDDLLEEVNSEATEVKNVCIDGFEHYFIIKKLKWDTEFFSRPMYKVLAVLFEHDCYEALTKAVMHFKETFLEETDKGSYCFLELPSEANMLIQSLTSNGFSLVETRLHHYLSNIKNFNYPRYDVRKAELSDIDNLAKVSSQARNKYDRFHSDVHFTNEIADSYLGRFAKETVNGLADMVLVPNEKDVAPDGLFAVNLLKNEWPILGVNVAQLVLAAVDANSCRGWYEKLLSEICHYLKENDVDYLITNTQTTNKAPIHVNEKLGFKYSHSTHILTISNV